MKCDILVHRRKVKVIVVNIGFCVTGAVLYTVVYDIVLAFTFVNCEMPYITITVLQTKCL